MSGHLPSVLVAVLKMPFHVAYGRPEVTFNGAAAVQDQHDVVVIGGGQAGLVMSALLQQRGFEHVVLERHRIGERWRTERWDSLRFQFPNWSIRMPGYCYAGSDPDGFAHYREILALLQQYAVATRAPVREQTEVVRLAEDERGFILSLADGAIRARRVVVATGPFQRPCIPQLSRGIPPRVLQIDATRYRSPSALPPGGVLVVGSGASGVQIADELVRAGRHVYLSVSRHRRAPRRFRGKDVYWWLDKLGRFEQTVETLPAGRWPPSTVITGVDGGYDVDLRELVGAGLEVIGRVIGAADRTVTIRPDANQILDDADAAYAGFVSAARAWAEAEGESDLAQEEGPVPSPGRRVEEATSLDLTSADVRTIIWATGYAYDYGWLACPVLDADGRPVQQRGVSSRPGLYFLGLHWMHTFKSGLLTGVGSDAAYILDHMSGRSH